MASKKNSIVRICKKVSESKVFQRFIVGTILLSAILAGIKTYSGLYQNYFVLLYFLDSLILAIFTAEIIIRILAFGSKFLHFFKSPWNVFDFAVTIVFYIPGLSNYASVLRIARVLRVLRLITSIPRLQIIVGALLHSFPSMGYIGFLLFIQFYVFAIVGNIMFGSNDPIHFGDLHTSLMTLFQIVTLEGWTEVMKAQGEGIFVWAYFVSFILLGTMVILNLFIGAILNGFEEVKKEIEEELSANKSVDNNIDKELQSIRREMNRLVARIDKITKKR